MSVPVTTATLWTLPSPPPTPEAAELTSRASTSTITVNPTLRSTVAAVLDTTASSGVNATLGTGPNVPLTNPRSIEA
jgi:hypothetical protein